MRSLSMHPMPMHPMHVTPSMRRPFRRQRLWRRRFAPGRLLTRADGNVSVELALLAPVLLLVFLGTVEYGRAYAERLILGRAARAQLQYAVDSFGATTVLNRIAALSTASPGGDPVTFTATRSCRCLGAASDCQTLCNGTSLPSMTIEVSATRNLSPIVFFPGHDGP